uniref:RING-type domain-containing protein n=2 Tax=Leptocylindrus danicus TaxID=163516 RepID=A0A7S2K0M8_9STRA|mmetsp:Transcript_15507/g.22895  ORF Transcript_15507/g.22895 Transcript_15507/m.22895 type:complete len:529 (+) Transcript_15507:136-1722(+)|eukprot:CAMPEP_0116019490 /NCGR_PEP_ID=MMETSP0321-20121206/9268_1 /TAXON_ID=163516 /ORGANISM="Leptocylindrus danicus var. danicus, Strain B650" /LENGTH=528 /DNA_ID=CAMNT_0003490071 /DNA_START=116 /DNA_END=1702 /DNA_ORIENTATION=+
MGNNSSTHNLKERISVKLGGQSTGCLGLSKKELDKLCQPTGLYASCSWDDRAIRRLIGDGKLAARIKGSDHRNDVLSEDCPICFLYYSKINITGCCKAHICSECFLQVRPQKVTPSKPAVCPFCNSNKLSVKIAQLTDEAAMKREEEEQNVIEAQIRARKNSEASYCSTVELDNDADDSERKMSVEELQMRKSNNMSSNSLGSSAPSTPKLTKTESNGFGSSLERDLQIRRRALSDMSSDCGSNGNINSPKLFKDDEVPVYASVDERRKLEEEMRKQVNHSLVRQMAEDSAVASASLPQVGGSLSRVRRSSMRRRFGRGQERDWNEIVEAFEQEGGEIQSLDDLVVLEAAIILSMEEQARQQRGEGAGNNGDGSSNNDVNGDRSEDNASSSTNNDSRIASNLLRSGLPVLDGLVRRRIPESDDDDDQDDEYRRIVPRRGMPARMRFRRATRDGYSMGGLTEDEQMAMAIALSLRDVENQQNNNSSENNNNENDGNDAGDQNQNENENPSDRNNAATISAVEEDSVSEA